MSFERSDRMDGYTKSLEEKKVREERLAYHTGVEARRKEEKRERIRKVVDAKTTSALKVSPSELVNILTELL